MTPIYLVRDPELFKQIAIKDFDNFQDHKSLIDTNVDKLFGNTMFMMRGQRWKDMRATLTPAFTVSKTKQMFELIRACAIDTSEFYLAETAKTGHSRVIEMQELFCRYANDVIASCAYGIKINSLEDKNNEFYAAGKRIMNFTSNMAFVKLFVQRSLPWLMRSLDIQFIDKSIRTFFTQMVLDTMRVRKSQGIIRPDLIDILLRAREGSLEYQEEDQSFDGYVPTAAPTQTTKKTRIHRNWSDEEMISQCFDFFLGGFDSSSLLLVSTAYELAMHPDIQQRLIDEVDEIDANLSGELVTYDDMQKMKYMDMVINEVLRIRPPSVLLDRVCSKDCILDDGDKVKIHIAKGSLIWVPVYNFHHDERFFPEPEKFDPERFNEENKANLGSAAYG